MESLNYLNSKYEFYTANYTSIFLFLHPQDYRIIKATQLIW